MFSSCDLRLSLILWSDSVFFLVYIYIYIIDFWFVVTMMCLFSSLCVLFKFWFLNCKCIKKNPAFVLFYTWLLCFNIIFYINCFMYPLEGLGAGGEGDDRGWDGWMASLTWWAWVWVNSGSWWWTGRPGVLRFMGLQRVGHDWMTDLIWKLLIVDTDDYITSVI